MIFLTKSFESRISNMKAEPKAKALAAYSAIADEKERGKAELFLEILNDKEDLRNWLRTYLKIELVSDTIDEDSNSNPLDAMWQIYECVRDNKGDEIPGYIMLSAREAFKTLSASMLEVLLLLHFQVSISHMAAIQKQSDKAVSYINSFLNKLEPIIKANGWDKITDSKTKIQFITPEENDPYIVIIICTISGANSEHTPIMFIDEIDVVGNPNAYEEAKYIPAMGKNGRFPITVKLSTRKFAFGLMQKELDSVKETGEKVLRWNVLDITEKCLPSKYQPDQDGKKSEIFVAKKLPLKYLIKEEVEVLPVHEKGEWSPIQVHPGCLKCKLVSVCKGKLADKPNTSLGNLYRPIVATIKSFAGKSTDSAEAQLLCWRPSTKGLVYSRFDEKKNLLTIDQAYTLLTGDEVKNVKMEEFVSLLKRIDSKIVAGIDWGFTKEATIVVMAVTKIGYSFILKTFGAPQLELSEFLEEGIKINDVFGIDKWFCDTAYPANIKTWAKKFGKSKVPDFKKDVQGGIEAIRGQLVDAAGKRMLYVINDNDSSNEPYNAKLIQGFKVHHFILDATGNPTKNPDDEEFSDVMDALRYIGQNMFAVKSSGKILVSSESTAIATPASFQNISTTHSQQLRNEIASRATEVVVNTEESNTKGKKMYWDF